MNNISFTGIKNIADIGYQKSGNKVASALSMVLTDDFRGKDLSEFKSVIDRVAKKSKNFRHKDGVEFLNIEKCDCLDGTDITNSMKFYLNGKEVKLKDENLPIFSYLAKLTKKIANMDKKDMIVNEDYKQFEASSKLIYGVEVDKGVLGKPDDYDRFFSKSIVKSCAKSVNSVIQAVMESYFGVSKK